MKKQVFKQLESLIKNLNEKNEKYSTVKYEMGKPNHFMRGRYSVIITYDMVFSTDMNDIMNFVLNNGLLLRLGVYRTGKPYMDIQ